jgi:hypothetical protein
LDDELETEVDLLAQEPEIEINNLGFDDDELDSLIGEVTLDDEDIADAFDDIPEGERSEIRQKTFTLSEEQLKTVDRAIEQAKDMGDFPPGANDNANGNALHRVCDKFLQAY